MKYAIPAKAFDKFYRGDEARRSKDGHSGLGLFIVKQLLEQLEGSIKLSSTESGGACVTFQHKVFSNTF
jgi:signal transduction histidine kinase